MEAERGALSHSAEGVFHARARGRSTVTVGREASRRGACVLGGPTRIIAPIMGNDPAELAEDVEAAKGKPVDLIEWRVDPLLAACETPQARREAIERAWVQSVSLAPCPVLATIRTRAEGGMLSLSEGEYAEHVRFLSSLADAVDVEIEHEEASALIADAHESGVVVVASAHDFSGTLAREHYERLLARMDAAGADVLKVASFAHCAADTAQILALQEWASARFSRPIILIGMGAFGVLTRVAGSGFGASATFASLREASAPGQLSIEETRTLLDLLERS